MTTITVRIKDGFTHRVQAENYDPKNPTGKPGPLKVAGDVIQVTQQELDAFGDKFEVVEEKRSVGRPKKEE